MGKLVLLILLDLSVFTHFLSCSLLFTDCNLGVSKSGAAQERLREAQAINLSLSALGDVISALSKGESFIPYRNHKLTLLMSDSLGGNAKTLMIVCVAPALVHVEESLSSLSFAARAKMITNNPVKMVFRFLTPFFPLIISFRWSPRK